MQQKKQTVFNSTRKRFEKLSFLNAIGLAIFHLVAGWLMLRFEDVTLLFIQAEDWEIFGLALGMILIMFSSAGLLVCAIQLLVECRQLLLEYFLAISGGLG